MPISDAAHKAALEAVRAEKPSQFTVGGSWQKGKLTGGITYDRKLANLWGLTAYARAYWEDLPVTTHKTLTTEAGVELTRKF